ncbi:DUF3108 domain-containing protein [Mariniphaga sediminis]|uniref:DUF3108 domain-containing protein n=2 Tax=Mariniphaga sediminis TaxID=1628158 RepID=A0A399D2H1_9BACT|nr:DUF3108 domain-containing protein [Mariniphaga sediminis]RIH65673.1 DUF3108 domain-containing protein [Mariniphaga sediminis]
MKKEIIIALLILVFSLHAKAREEKIFFNLKFGFIKGGEAELIISDTIFNNKKALHYYLKGRTTGLTDKLFEVNDIYETTVDAETRLPLKSIRNIKEGKYRWYNETIYYHDIDSINSQKSGWRDAPENLVDIISVFFYFIHHHLLDDLEPGSRVTLPTFHADKIDDVSVKYLGDRRIETDFGKIDCYVLTPSVDKGKLLNRSDGLKFFISKKTKMPVLLEFDMRIGSLKAEIQKYEVDGKTQAAR